VNRYKTAKHLRLTIEDGVFTCSRKQSVIHGEASTLTMSLLTTPKHLQQKVPAHLGYFESQETYSIRKSSTQAILQLAMI